MTRLKRKVGLNRLKKKAGARRTFYHGTCLAVLEDIVNNGQGGHLMPGGYTGNISGGDASGEASAQEDAVFLSTTPKGYYAEKATEAIYRPNYNVGIILEVEVDEDALAPDNDDAPNATTWQESVELTKQCVHIGPIFLDEIKSVAFTGYVKSTPETLYQFANFDGHDFDDRLGDELYDTLGGMGYRSVPEFMQRVAKADQLFQVIVQEETEELQKQQTASRLRLKKKAGARITLYHDSSVTIFEEIVASGQIMPGGFTGNISNGIPGGIDPMTGKPRASGQQDCVYLRDEEGWGYYNKAVQNNPRGGNKLNFGIIFKVSVDEDALTADYDDLRDGPDKSSDVPAWKQSLEMIHQCAHIGPIFLDEIIGVKAKPSHLNEEDIQIEVLETMGQDFLSVSEFAARLQQLDAWYAQYIQDGGRAQDVEEDVMYDQMADQYDAEKAMGA